MRYMLTLDLKNDPQLIREYEAYHREVWPEVKAAILRSGIKEMTIYRFENRLCMLLDTGGDFSFERKGEIDAADPKVQEWESLMWKYQQAMPGAKEGEKWMLMNKIFQLS